MGFGGGWERGGLKGKGGGGGGGGGGGWWDLRGAVKDVALKGRGGQRKIKGMVTKRFLQILQ